MFWGSVMVARLLPQLQGDLRNGRAGHAGVAVENKRHGRSSARRRVEKKPKTHTAETGRNVSG